MNKCPRCENENLKEHYNYCPVCGVNLGTALEVPVQEQYEFSSKCNICSYENELKVTKPKNMTVDLSGKPIEKAKSTAKSSNLEL